MSEVQIAYVLLGSGLVGLSLVIRGIVTMVFSYKESRKNSYVEKKYSLYEVRDKLIRYVAEGKLDEDGIIFSTLYPMVNKFIRDLKEYELDPVVDKAIYEGRNSELEKSDFVNRFEEAIRESPSEVRDLVKQFTDTMIALLIMNSKLVNLLIRATHISVMNINKYIKKVAKACSLRIGFLERDEEIYQTIEQFEKLKKQTQKA